MGAEFAVGVDIGGTKILAALFSQRDGLVDSVHIPSDRHASPEELLGRVELLVRRLVSRSGTTVARLVGVGVGVPGLVDPAGIFMDSIILPSWKRVDVASDLSHRLQTSVLVDNDATMAAIGHWRTIDDGALSTLLCLTLGTGVGGAVVFNGSPLRGRDGTAGQLGHVTVDRAGRPCSCGARGCLNAYASGTALADQYNEKATRDAQVASGGRNRERDARWVARAAEEGDVLALETIDGAARALGAGLASLVNVFNPEVILLAGGVLGVGDRLLAPTRSIMTSLAFRQPGARVRVQTPRYGVAAGAVGAAMAVWSPR